MSRCFPYPPPGYERVRTHDVAMIESIKLQREGEKAKKERRKEKKREKKEKEKARKDGEVGDKKHSHKRRHKDERSQEDKKGGDHHKRRESETEQVEKSNLTEEKGHPVGHPVASHDLCNSTDSTSNSSKRQKHGSPPDSRHNPGSILRIRLPLQRHKDPEVLPPSFEQPCSSRRTDAYVQEKCKVATLPGCDGRRNPCSTSSTHQEIAVELGKEKPCSSSRASKTTANKAEKAHAPRLHPLELQFRNLLENWPPPPLQLQQTDFDDQNWLFGTTQNRKSGAEGSTAISDCLSVANSTQWPLSRYLPEADIYALPFTIPF